MLTQASVGSSVGRTGDRVYDYPVAGTGPVATHPVPLIKSLEYSSHLLPFLRNPQ